MLISFLYDKKNSVFLVEISVWQYGYTAQILFFCVCSAVALRKLFFFFFNKIQDGRITCYSQELELFYRFFHGSNLPWPYANRFWCDSNITFSRGLHKNLVTVGLLYFSIINVLCGVQTQALPVRQIKLFNMISNCRKKHLVYWFM